MKRAAFTALLVAAAALGFSPGSYAQPKKGAPAAAPPPAKGDPKLADAKKLFDDGAELYAKGNYEQAIDAWQKSYELSKKPLIFESIANGYERLGDAKKAREYLGRWREVAPKDEWELLDQRLKNLDARITRDDEAAAQRKAENKKLIADIEAKERERAATTGNKPEKPGPPIGAVLLAAGGGVAVVTGVILDILAASGRPGADACKTAPSGSTLCRDADRGAVTGSNGLALAGDIAWIAGGAVAVTGIVLIVTRKKPKDEAAPPPATGFVAPAFGPGYGGVTIQHSF